MWLDRLFLPLFLLTVTAFAVRLGLWAFGLTPINVGDLAFDALVLAVVATDRWAVHRVRWCR